MKPQSPPLTKLRFIEPIYARLVNEDSEEPFSFRGICETLGLHPDHIRKGLLVWKEAKIKKSSLEGHPQGRQKLAKSCVMPTSVRLSKTA
jgi:hypothetical protein